MASNKSAIIVISSHVARGAVGNRVMVPVLEELGFDVWAVPTVVLPFHPGQGPGRRIVPSDEEFADLLDDLGRRVDADRAVSIISGYLGTAGQADATARLVCTLQRKRDVAFVCDPVIGDAAGLYVPEPVAEAVRDTLVPMASIITPNRYEHDWLTGKTCESIGQWLQSSQDLAPPCQVITSVPQVPGAAIGNLLTDQNDTLYCGHTRFDAVPSGTGDMFTAAFAGLLARGETPENALRLATVKVHGSVADSVHARASDLLIRPGFENPGSVVSLQRYDADSGWSEQRHEAGAA